MVRQSRPFVLLTRPQAQSERFVGDLRDCGATCVIAPVMQIERINAVYPPHDGDFVLTSENALRTLPDIFNKPGRRAFCVGRQTARAAQRMGFDAISADGNAEDLRELLTKVKNNNNLLHLSGEHQVSAVLEDIPNLRRIVTYRQTEMPPDTGAQTLLGGEARVIVPLFSPRSARLFFKIYPNIAAPLHIVAISKATANAVQHGAATKIDIAAQPNGDNMKKLVAELI
ncbi:uroporphyrinogen-III synthase [Halocynthiibacter namhaensis]|uniref:uroporphyrinogen-III synthase n=1 Tax=Halocynthiibacter namhaensis TaxID=1290553 RepID=UPI00057946F0|nr:uroporphyrinogen-III synthase [Halocynthiibacter namhaensis]